MGTDTTEIGKSSELNACLAFQLISLKMMNISIYWIDEGLYKLQDI